MPTLSARGSDAQSTTRRAAYAAARLLIATGLSLVAACRAEVDRASSESVADTTAPSSTAVAAPATQQATGSSDSLGVLDLLAELRSTPTAGAWATGSSQRLSSLGLYDVDTFYELPPIFGTQPSWCLRSIQVDSLPSGLTRRRYYFFYYDAPMPDAPADLAPPQLSSGIDYQLRSCSLRMIASEIRGADAPSILAELGRTHAGSLGEPADDVAFSTLPYGLRRDGVTTWSAADVTVAVGMGVTDAPIAMAVLPIPDVRIALTGASSRSSGTSAWISELLDLALEAAAPTEETRAVIASIRAIGPVDTPGPSPDVVLSVLRELVAKPDRIAPGDPETNRYAARLSAADLLLRAHYPDVPGPGDAVAFNELGANYSYSELDYQTLYRGSLADSAAALPPGSGDWRDVGRIALLEEGCNWDPTLETTAELLPRISDPRIRARLHYLRAEALASIIAFHRMAQLRPGVVSDIEEVRREAMEHYRAALTGELGELDRVGAWYQAWSVATNYGPGPRYDCRRA